MTRRRGRRGFAPPKDEREILTEIAHRIAAHYGVSLDAVRHVRLFTFRDGMGLMDGEWERLIDGKWIREPDMAGWRKAVTPSTMR